MIERLLTAKEIAARLAVQTSWVRERAMNNAPRRDARSPRLIRWAAHNRGARSPSASFLRRFSPRKPADLSGAPLAQKRAAEGYEAVWRLNKYGEDVLALVGETT